MAMAAWISKDLLRVVVKLLSLASAFILPLIVIDRIFGGVTFLGIDGVILQKTACDCGPTALQMILRNFGIQSPQETKGTQAAGACEGISMLQLKTTAEIMGLRCAAWRLSVDELKRIPLPAILYLRRGHFVVLESCTSHGRFIVLDPARGRLSFSPRRLQRLWEGETLLFCQSKQTPEPSSEWFRAFAYTKGGKHEEEVYRVPADTAAPGIHGRPPVS